MINLESFIQLHYSCYSPQQCTFTNTRLSSWLSPNQSLSTGTCSHALYFSKYLFHGCNSMPVLHANNLHHSKPSTSSQQWQFTVFLHIHRVQKKTPPPQTKCWKMNSI